MPDMQASLKYMTCKSRSFFSKLSYENLKCIEWQNIISKMIFHQPRLLKILPVISITEKKVDNEHHYLSLAMKLGLIHDILKKKKSYPVTSPESDRRRRTFTNR